MQAINNISYTNLFNSEQISNFHNFMIGVIRLIKLAGIKPIAGIQSIYKGMRPLHIYISCKLKIFLYNFSIIGWKFNLFRC